MIVELNVNVLTRHSLKIVDQIILSTDTKKIQRPSLSESKAEVLKARSWWESGRSKSQWLKTLYSFSTLFINDTEIPGMSFLFC